MGARPNTRAVSGPFFERARVTHKWTVSCKLTILFTGRKPRSASAMQQTVHCKREHLFPFDSVCRSLFRQTLHVVNVSFLADKLQWLDTEENVPRIDYLLVDTGNEWYPEPHVSVSDTPSGTCSSFGGIPREVTWVPVRWHGVPSATTTSTRTATRASWSKQMYLSRRWVPTLLQQNTDWQPVSPVIDFTHHVRDIHCYLGSNHTPNLIIMGRAISEL